ncbi:hypothetical protein LPJ73_000792, partial [Coemansia sp. RSA 2703]
MSENTSTLLSKVKSLLKGKAASKESKSETTLEKTLSRCSDMTLDQVSLTKKLEAKKRSAELKPNYEA